MMSPYLTEHWSEIITVSRNIGYIGGAVTFVYALFKYLKKAFKTVKTANDNLSLIMTNHLPHIQSTMSTHVGILQDIKSDVRNLETTVNGYKEILDDTKRDVGSLSKSFIAHLENSSSEKMAVVTVPVKPIHRRSRRRG